MRGIPVLAFHAIQSGPGPLRVDAERFAAVVAALVEAGATGITASHAARIVAGESEGPAKPVAFTFDDGYRSVHRNAMPVLRAVGWPGTIFPVTGALGHRNTWDGPGVEDLEVLDIDSLAQLQAEGWEIGGHSHTHRSLRGVSAAEVTDELEQADAALAQAVGSVPESFAYPYGHFDDTSARVAAARYRWCWTIGAARTRRGDLANLLPRIEGWYVRRPVVARHLHDVTGTAWLAARRGARRLRSRRS
jgi:peptidoglycan/xylan/chitin deacetylase (PgdA/CDA1 family)